MNKSSTFTFRINPEIKQEATELFEGLGITLSDAINLFLYRAVQDGGLPFEVKKAESKKGE